MKQPWQQQQQQHPQENAQRMMKRRRPNNPTSFPLIPQGTLQQQHQQPIVPLRRRRRRLRVPSSEASLDALATGDAYEQQNSSTFFANKEDVLWLCRTARPFPLSSVLAFLPPSSKQDSTTSQQQRRGLDMPLLEPLRPYFVRDKNQDGTTTGETNNVVAEESNFTLEDIHDPRHSTLTLGQHVRYKQLLHSQPSSTTTKSFSRSDMIELRRKKEFRRLRSLVEQEQARYQQTLDRFYTKHLHRYKLGIPSSFAECKAHAAELYREEWNGLPVRYGKCRQVLSLRHVSRELLVVRHHHQQKKREGDFTTTTATNRHPWTPDAFETSLIEHTTTNPTAAAASNKESNTDSFDLHLGVPTSWLHHNDDDDNDNDDNKNNNIVTPKRNRRRIIPPLDKSRMPPHGLLQTDRTAMELAKVHGAHIVTTTDTLQALLQLPGDQGVQWTIPLYKPQQNQRKQKQEEHFLILEAPLPQPSDPRECLARGVQEGLFQWWCSQQQQQQQQHEQQQTDQSSTTSHSSHEDAPPAHCYSYTLLTLPTSLHHPGSSTSAKTTPGKSGRRHRQLKVLVRTCHRVRDKSMIHVQLEYFYATQKWRECPTSLDRAQWILARLLCPRVYVAHVDPSCFELIKLEPISLAHALLSSSSSLKDGPEQTRDFSVPCTSATTSTDTHDGASTPTNATRIDATTRRVTAAVDPMQHLEAMVEFLYATEQLPEGAHQVLCLSGTAVSVHDSVEVSSEDLHDDSAATYINIQDAFENGGAVYTGAAALRRCIRIFEWKDERVPYTFPINKDAMKRPPTSRG